MKKFALIFGVFFLIFGATALAEDILYMEDFDTGMGNWVGEWGLDSRTGFYHSSPNALADSPNGNYADYDTVEVMLDQDIDLSAYPTARVMFWTRYDIEVGFDYIYFYGSSDGGNNWLLLHTFNGNEDWHIFQTDIGGFCGSQIRFKFRLESDAGWNEEGMNVDDFVVAGDTLDTSPPLIVHEGATDSTFAPETFSIVADITDFNGVQSATVTYRVDGGSWITTNPINIVGDTYYFVVPEQEAGAHVEYYITAEDPIGNSIDTDTYMYMAGWMVYYDDGDPEYRYYFDDGEIAATKFTPAMEGNLVTGIYRLYQDNQHFLDTVDVEIWEVGGNGYPGTSIWGPLAVWPQSTPENPQGWTYIDFRGENILVDTDFYSGCTFRDTIPNILGDSPGVTGRSVSFINGGWTGAGAEWHYRVVMDYDIQEPYVNIDMIPDEYPITVNPGGSFSYTGVLQNNLGVGGRGDVWLMLNVPGIGMYGPIRRINNIPIQPHQFIALGGVVQDIPAIAPTGVYDYIAYCGYYPNFKADSAVFQFTVATVGEVGPATDWTVHGWFDDQEASAPGQYALLGNYPNPFNATTEIRFTLPAQSEIRLDIYNILGQRVETLIDGVQPAGEHHLSWDASNVASGVYFYKLSVGEQVFTKKMTLLK